MIDDLPDAPWASDLPDAPWAATKSGAYEESNQKWAKDVTAPRPDRSKGYLENLNETLSGARNRAYDAGKRMWEASDPLHPSISAPLTAAGGLADIAGAAGSAIASPATAAFRTYVSGPEEKYVGIPAEKFEDALMIGAGGAKIPKLTPSGRVLEQMTGRPPVDMGALERAITPTTEASSAGAAGVARNPLEDYSPQTIAAMRAAARNEGLTPEIIEDITSGLSPHHMLGEITPGFENRMAGVAAHADTGRSIIEQALNQRARETAPRMKEAFDQAFGPNQNRAVLGRAIEQDQAQNSKPFWDAFRQTEVTPTPRIDKLLPRLEASGALRAANKAMREEGLPFDNGFSENPAPGAPEQRIPTAQAFQYAKEHLDDQIEAAMASPGGKNTARRYTALKNELVNAIDEHPDQNVAGVWKAARDEWGRSAELLDGLKFGNRIMTGHVGADELPFLTSGFSPDKMAAARIGIRGYFEDLMNGRIKPTRADLAKVLAPANQQKLQLVLGDRQAEQLIAAVEHEESMWNAPTRIVYGSPTAVRQTAKQEWQAPEQRNLGDMATSAVHAVHHPIRSAIGAVGNKIMGGRQAAAEAQWAKTREDAARLMTLQGRERDAALRALIGQTEALPERWSVGQHAGQARASGGSVAKITDYLPKALMHRRRAEGGGLSDADIESMTHHEPDVADRYAYAPNKSLARVTDALPGAIYNTLVGTPARAAKSVVDAVYSGQNPEGGDLLSAASLGMTARMPFAKPGTIGVGGGRMVQPAHGTTHFDADANVDPTRIEPFNKVEKVKVNKIADSMRESGWIGRPLLAYEGSNGLQAVTGSHRIAAARKADVDVPVMLLDDEAFTFRDKNGKTFDELYDDNDKARFLSQLSSVDEKYRKASELMSEEVKLNGQSVPHADNLLGAGIKELEFQKAYNALDAGKSKIPLTDLSEIVSDYHNRPTGATHQYTFKNKADAMDALRRKFLSRAQQENGGNDIAAGFGSRRCGGRITDHLPKALMRGPQGRRAAV